ncbi:hypothetical protein [Agromyces sp. LHK192]|uniref:hypothetical protein n=1 Tax=Agromyces sp. LHK192 TaxID=2498704 RepID=UPI000FD74C3A|nr:hypothetical protein [Agromyces sp. LHK192]
MSSIGDALSRAVLDAAALDGEPDQQSHLTLVRLSAEAEREARGILRQSVESARAGGVSWSAIGTELGMTRQAAQQRFGDASRDGAPADDREYRWLGPVTAFDEMAELELAGRAGWHTVEVGILRHLMVRTDTQWEHKRVVFRGLSRRDADDGWVVAAQWFPWAYLVRDLGVPAK